MLQLGYQIDWQRKEVHDGGVMGAEKTNKQQAVDEPDALENSWAVWAFTRLWHAVKYWVVNKDP